MADKKISALTAATTPLAGTEVLPIVQSSNTVKVAVSDLTAGRAISATQLTLTTGNLIVANGQGIDFSATSHPAGMTSELLADYEEGTWTPTASGWSGTYTTQSGTYTKVGRLVTVSGRIVVVGGTGTWSGFVQVGGLPFTGSNPFSSVYGTWVATAGVNTAHGTATAGGPIYTAGTEGFFGAYDTVGNSGNWSVTYMDAAANAEIRFTMTYPV